MFCFHKDRGAISVFLVIILVPCMLISSIFVDISRVQLARAVAESSADLALSTLMTNYDYDLSEYYGLMGSCQNISEYYDMVTEYYDTALHSRDVDDEEVQLLYQQVMRDMSSRFSNETISDILRVQNQTQGAVISPLEGANMYNATILQEQVVEFMKYRGPIVITQGIIEKIKSDPGVSDLKDSDENKTLVDDKTEFYEAEGELLKAAFDVYWDTRAYTDEVEKRNMSAQKLQEYAQNLVNYREAYGEIHRYLVGNLMNTGELSSAYSRVTIDLDIYKDNYDKTSTEIYSRKETPTPPPAPTLAPGATAAPSSTPAPPPEPIYYIDGDKVTALMGELRVAKEDFKAAMDNFISAGSSLMNTLPGAGDSDAYAVQWWLQMEYAVNSRSETNYTEELKSKADDLARAYAKVLAITDCEYDGISPELDSSRAALLNEVKELHDKYLVAGRIDDGAPYLETVNRLEQVSAANWSRLQAANLYVDVDGQSRSLENAVAYIQKQLDEMQKDVQLYEGLLDKLLNAPKKGSAPMDNLYSLAGEYASTLNTWTQSADAATTDMAGEHREEIEKLKNLQDEDKNSTKICVTIDRDAVEKMKTRLVNIRSQYRTIDDAIETMQYGNMLLREILNVSTMKSCAAAVVQTDSIGLTNREVREYADSTFPQLFIPAAGDIAALHDINDNAYNPLMNPDTGQIDTPDLYQYMHSRFMKTRPEVVEKEEEEQEKARDQKEKEEEKAKTRPRYHGEGKDIEPTSASSGNGFELGNVLEALIEIVMNLFTGEVDNIRDNLYVTAYIMEMFSYATFEYEGYYSLLSEEERGQLRLPRESYERESYESVYHQYKGAAEIEGSWLSANVKDSYNKTLTNRLINQENNVAYLAEVEYILYGKSNVESVKKAYGDIFTVRYALNLVSAFANFWKGNNNTSRAINGVAAFVASITAGVIPAALTKVILLPIITTFETCKDLDRLEAGFPVELYKQAGDWWYGFDGSEADGDWGNKKVSDFMNALKGGLTGNRTNPDKGLQYSDYLTLFVYLGLQTGGETSEKMYLRMADVIQANMCKATGEKEYSLANTQVYFRLKAKLRVDPLMMALPYYSDYVDDPTMRDDWCTFEVETIRGY